MKRHDWWRHYRVDTPEPIPVRFYDLGFTEGGPTLGMNPTGDEVLPEYYRLVGALLSVAPSRSAEATVYVLRGFSLLLAVATLYVAWLGATAGVGTSSALVVTALLALHPQFAIASTSASPDALVNLAGASVWLGAVLALGSAKPLLPFTGMWLAAIVGAAADRVGVPLLAAAALVSLLLVVRHPLRAPLLLGTFAIVAIGALAAIADPRIALRVQSLLAGNEFQFIVADRAMTWEFFREFTALLFHSWWVVFGWLRYRAPEWWFVIPTLLACAAVVGLARRFVTRPRAPQQVVLALAIGMIAVQVGAVYWAFFRLDVSAQGRYLFPFLVPMLILFWTGLQALVPVRYQRHAAVALVATFALLDALAWLFVGLPAYVS